jgi:predicted Zn-ribbon and HTH transcriptional regulator
MGLFGSRRKWSGMTLPEVQSVQQPIWCVRASSGQVTIYNAGVIPYALRSKTFYGPKVEEWFSALLATTLATPQYSARDYAFLLEEYLKLLDGLRDILKAGWRTWENDEPGRAHNLTHDPLSGDPWNTFCINYASGTLSFLQKTSTLQNQLLAKSRGHELAWDSSLWRFKESWTSVGPGAVKTRVQSILKMWATPAVLQREMDRLSGLSTEPAIPGSIHDEEAELQSQELAVSRCEQCGFEAFNAMATHCPRCHVALVLCRPRE